MLIEIIGSDQEKEELLARENEQLLLMMDDKVSSDTSI
jgi:hypothetical protein